MRDWLVIDRSTESSLAWPVVRSVYSVGTWKWRQR